MSDYNWDHLEVGLVAWADGEEIEQPTGADVASLLDDIEAGDPVLSIHLEDDTGDDAPTLVFSCEDDGWSITLRSEDEDLWPEAEFFSLKDAKRIARLFCDELRLDPKDGWQPA